MIGLYGGDYNFFQNTLANFNFNFPRRSPSVYLSDNLNDNNALTKNLNATFTNNIIYGSLPRELEFSKKGTGSFVTNFTNNLIKTDQQAQQGATNIYNQDPLFLDARKENFRLTSNSPVFIKGANLNSNIYFSAFISKDIKGFSRVFPSTLGCYEK